MKITDLTLTRDTRIKKINKKTKAKMFDKCKEGDILHFSIKVKSVGANSRGTHAAYITVFNTRTSEGTTFSFNQAYFYADVFDLEEV